MFIVTRYVVAELLKWFLFTLTGFTLFMVMIFVGKEATQMGLGPGPTLRLVQFALPEALAFAIPASILFTVCLVYGRMSADNELIALKSLGVSPMALLWPGYILAFVLSVVAVWLNDVACSWGRTGMQRVVIQSVEEIVYGKLRSEHSFGNSRFSIIVRDVDNHRLIHPTITFHASQDAPGFTLVAAEAELRSNLEKNTLNVILTNYEVDNGGGVVHRDPGTKVHEVPLNFAANRESQTNAPTQLSLGKVPLEIAAQQRLIGQLEQTLSAEAGFAYLTGDFTMLSEGYWNAKQQSIADAQNRLHRLQTEPWRRWASGFSCLCFVLVGLPLAVRFRNSDYFSTFFLAFAPVLICYFPLLAWGLEKAKSGELPPYVVWAGNFLWLFAGWWLLKHVRRF